MALCRDLRFPSSAETTDLIDSLGNPIIKILKELLKKVPWSIDFFTARDFVQLQLRLYLNREGALTTSRGFFYVL